MMNFDTSRFEFIPQVLPSSEIDSPYAGSNHPNAANKSKASDRTYPRRDELFQDEAGNLYLYKVINGVHKYVKISADAASGSDNGDVVNQNVYMPYERLAKLSGQGIQSAVFEDGLIATAVNDTLHFYKHNDTDKTLDELSNSTITLSEVQKPYFKNKFAAFTYKNSVENISFRIIIGCKRTGNTSTLQAFKLNSNLNSAVTKYTLEIFGSAFNWAGNDFCDQVHVLKNNENADSIRIYAINVLMDATVNNAGITYDTGNITSDSSLLYETYAISGNTSAILTKGYMSPYMYLYTHGVTGKTRIPNGGFFGHNQIAVLNVRRTGARPYTNGMYGVVAIQNPGYLNSYVYTTDFDNNPVETAFDGSFDDGETVFRVLDNSRILNHINVQKGYEKIVMSFVVLTQKDEIYNAYLFYVVPNKAVVANNGTNANEPYEDSTYTVIRAGKYQFNGTEEINKIQMNSYLYLLDNGNILENRSDSLVIYAASQFKYLSAAFADSLYAANLEFINANGKYLESEEVKAENIDSEKIHSNYIEAINSKFDGLAANAIKPAGAAISYMDVDPLQRITFGEHEFSNRDYENNINGNLAYNDLYFVRMDPSRIYTLDVFSVEDNTYHTLEIDDVPSEHQATFTSRYDRSLAINILNDRLFGTWLFANDTELKATNFYSSSITEAIRTGKNLTLYFKVTKLSSYAATTTAGHILNLGSKYNTDAGYTANGSTAIYTSNSIIQALSYYDDTLQQIAFREVVLLNKFSNRTSVNESEDIYNANSIEDEYYLSVGYETNVEQYSSVVELRADSGTTKHEFMMYGIYGTYIQPYWQKASGRNLVFNNSIGLLLEDNIGNIIALKVPRPATGKVGTNTPHKITLTTDNFLPYKVAHRGGTLPIVMDSPNTLKYVSDENKLVIVNFDSSDSNISQIGNNSLNLYSSRVASNDEVMYTELSEVNNPRYFVANNIIYKIDIDMSWNNICSVSAGKNEDPISIPPNISGIASDDICLYFSCAYLLSKYLMIVDWNRHQVTKFENPFRSISTADINAKSVNASDITASKATVYAGLAEHLKINNTLKIGNSTLTSESHVNYTHGLTDNERTRYNEEIKYFMNSHAAYAEHLSDDVHSSVHTSTGEFNKNTAHTLFYRSYSSGSQSYWDIKVEGYSSSQVDLCITFPSSAANGNGMYLYMDIDNTIPSDFNPHEVGHRYSSKGRAVGIPPGMNAYLGFHETKGSNNITVTSYESASGDNKISGTRFGYSSGYAGGEHFTFAYDGLAWNESSNIIKVAIYAIYYTPVVIEDTDNPYKNLIFVCYEDESGAGRYRYPIILTINKSTNKIRIEEGTPILLRNVIFESTPILHSAVDSSMFRATVNGKNLIIQPSNLYTEVNPRLAFSTGVFCGMEYDGSSTSSSSNVFEYSDYIKLTEDKNTDLSDYSDPLRNMHPILAMNPYRSQGDIPIKYKPKLLDTYIRKDDNGETLLMAFQVFGSPICVSTNINDPGNLISKYYAAPYYGSGDDSRYGQLVYFNIMTVAVNVDNDGRMHIYKGGVWSNPDFRLCENRTDSGIYAWNLMSTYDKCTKLASAKFIRNGDYILTKTTIVPMANCQKFESSDSYDSYERYIREMDEPTYLFKINLNSSNYTFDADDSRIYYSVHGSEGTWFNNHTVATNAVSTTTSSRIKFTMGNVSNPVYMLVSSMANTNKCTLDQVTYDCCADLQASIGQAQTESFGFATSNSNTGHIYTRFNSNLAIHMYSPLPDEINIMPLPEYTNTANIVSPFLSISYMPLKARGYLNDDDTSHLFRNVYFAVANIAGYNTATKKLVVSPAIHQEKWNVSDIMSILSGMSTSLGMSQDYINTLVSHVSSNLLSSGWDAKGSPNGRKTAGGIPATQSEYNYAAVSNEILNFNRGIVPKILFAELDYIKNEYQKLNNGRSFLVVFPRIRDKMIQFYVGTVDSNLGMGGKGTYWEPFANGSRTFPIVSKALVTPYLYLNYIQGTDISKNNIDYSIIKIYKNMKVVDNKVIFISDCTQESLGTKNDLTDVRIIEDNNLLGNETLESFIVNIDKPTVLVYDGDATELNSFFEVSNVDNIISDSPIYIKN